MAATHWILRVGDGVNLINSSKYKIWGIQSTTNDNKYFLKTVKIGDLLWFVKNKSCGKIIAVATYLSHNQREVGPLINITMANEDLGWISDTTDWISDIEIHYTDLYGLNECDLFTHIVGPKTIRKYNEKCRIDLEVEYSHIVRYSKITIGL
jgi:hypothetical protein